MKINVNVVNAVSYKDEWCEALHNDPEWIDEQQRRDLEEMGYLWREEESDVGRVNKAMEEKRD